MSQTHRIEPELGHLVFPFDVDMGWFIAIAGIEEGSVRGQVAVLRAWGNYSVIPASPATVLMSLSPRPDRFTSRILSRSRVGASLAA